MGDAGCTKRNETFFQLAARATALLVAVAVGAAEVVHEVAEDLVVGDEAEGDHVGELHGVAGRVVVEGGGAVDDVLAAVDVEVLPNDPDAVDHAVVEEEDRVVGAGVEVLELGGAAAEPVATAVDAEGVVVAAVALHELLEVLDVDLAEDEVGDVLVAVVLAADRGVQVTGQAAAVVVEVALDVLVAVGRADGAKVGDKVVEGAVLDAATTSSGREVDLHGSEPGVGPVGNVLSVATHRPLVTVEDLTVLGSGGISGPVPVGHVAGVATQVPQVLLQGVDEEAVPCQEVGGHVDLGGVVDVSGDELVVTGEDTRVVGTLSIGHALRRGVVKAGDGVGEGLALVLRHGPELLADLGIVVGAGLVAAVDVVTHATVGGVAHILEGGARLDVLGGVVGEGGRLSKGEAGDGGQASKGRNEMHNDWSAVLYPEKKWIPAQE